MKKIRYRCPTAWETPMPGLILMGDGPRVRRAYRVLAARRSKSDLPALGLCTWNLSVEVMSAARGREEIEAGCPAWCIVWDKRGKRA